MKKDFDSWNLKKKYIEENEPRRFYRSREIWWCSLGVNIGFEQDGTSHDQQRPVLILKGFSREVCLVVPLTTSKKKNPYHFSIGKINNTIKTVSPEDISELLPQISDPPKNLRIQGQFPRAEGMKYLTVVGSRKYSDY